jgi:hypothetical protein
VNPNEALKRRFFELDLVPFGTTNPHPLHKDHSNKMETTAGQAIPATRRSRLALTAVAVCLLGATVLMGLSVNPKWNWVNVTGVSTTNVTTATVPTTRVTTTVYLLSTTNYTVTTTQVLTTTVAGTSNSTTSTSQPTNSMYGLGACAAPFFVSLGHMMVAATICSGVAFFATIGEMCPFPDNPKKYAVALSNLMVFLGAVLCASSLGRASVGTNCYAVYSGTFGNVTVTRAPDCKFFP